MLPYKFALPYGLTSFILSLKLLCHCPRTAPCSEADRLEEMEGAEAAAGLMGEEENGMAGVDTKANAVCVINAQGIIQMANKVGMRHAYRHVLMPSQ
jgi:hypothetical protein